ncbi:MAG TPA: penicillin-binding transpeptidase domain-containing protein [Verrucomicrobiae bacterium]|jgi:penicillin-binding protein 2
MLIVDELKKNDPQLQLVAVMVVVGLVVLFAGLWWVQVVSAREYQTNLQTQSYRSVRVPAVRGKILDCEGRILAENQAHYNLSLYLDDLSTRFDQAYKQLHRQGLALQQREISTEEKTLHRSLSKDELKKYAFTTKQLSLLAVQARWSVAQNVTAGLSQDLGQPVLMDWRTFERAYETRLYVPFPVLQNLDVSQIARFEEHFSPNLGANLDMQPARFYPYGDTAAHLLGYVAEDSASIEGENAYFSYRLPDYSGRVGIEGGFDSVLHGRAGDEEVEVNNYGYKQAENILDAPQPGENVQLTIDLDIQRVAEQSLLAHRGADAKAAIVVMDVRNGDVLAMVSSPAINPIFSQNSAAYLDDTNLEPQINRATYGNYAPGSIFKPVIALAALENGLNPDSIVDNPGYVMVGRRHIGDLAPPGQYNLRRAIIYSSNTYFVTIGLHSAGIQNIVRLANKFHFGQKADLPTGQDIGGHFPNLQQVSGDDWRDGDSANICIGQGQMAVTPLQMTVAYSAIANGGTIFWPRLVSKIEPQDPTSGGMTTNFPAGVVRDHIGVSQRSLQILRSAMLAETEDPEGTGHNAVVGPAMRICGKTGTAQVMDTHNREITRNTWFASYAPYEHPHYAVVVMVENRDGFGGPTCAPIAHDIYEELLKKDQASPPPLAMLK